MSVVKKNLVFNILLSVSQVFFPLISFPYASRILGPQGIGSVSFVDSITQYFILFSALGIPTYGVREVARVKRKQNELNKLFSELILIHLFVTIFYFIIYISIILIWAKSSHIKSLYWIGCGILILNVFLIEWFFQGIEQFKFITVRTLFIRIIVLGLLFFLVRKSNDIFLYYMLTFVTVVASVIVNFYHSRRYVRFVFVGLDFKKHFKPLLYILGSTLAISAYVLLDNIILGLLTNDEAVGFYSSSVRITKISLSLITALGLVLVPNLSASFKENDLGRIRELLNKSFAFVITLSVPIAVGLYLLAPILIRTIAGSKFEPAVMTLRIMTPITILIGLSNIFGVQILTPMQKEKYLFWSVSIGMFVSIALNFILIPFFSQNGAALTTVLTEAVVTILTWYYARKYFSIKFEFDQFYKSLISAAGFIPLYYILRILISNEIISAVILIVLSPVLYFIIQIVFLKNKYLSDIYFQLMRKIRYEGV